MDEGDVDGVALVARAGVAGLAAIIATADPNVGIVAASMLPVLDVGIERVRQFRRAACGYTIQVASDTAAVTPEELVDLLVATPEKVQLLASALEAASETAWEVKFRVLGQGLANGALTNDDAKVMEETWWTRILRGLEAPHLRIIAHLMEEDSERPGHMIISNRAKLKDVSGFSELIAPALAAMEQNSLLRSSDGSEMDEQTRGRWGIGKPNGMLVYSRGELTAACLARFNAAGVS